MEHWRFLSTRRFLDYSQVCRDTPMIWPWLTLRVFCGFHSVLAQEKQAGVHQVDIKGTSFSFFFFTPNSAKSASA